jgi:hypothetical protein
MKNYKTIPINELWDVMIPWLGGWMEFIAKPENEWKSTEDYHEYKRREEQKEIKKNGKYGFMNFEWWKFENPTIDRIKKVFPWEHREFDNNIWLRHDYNTWFISEDDLKLYIDKWLSWEFAWAYYNKTYKLYHN